MKIVRQLVWVILCLYSMQAAATNTQFVSQHGELSVNGTHLVNEHHQIIQLRGMSLFWSQWSGAFYNKKVVNTLANDWQATVVRAALGVEKGGYLSQPEMELKKIETVIEAAIAADIYVIVDFHSHDAQKYQQQAIEFFSHIAHKYGQYPHVIYEVYNEPDYESWSADIKPYAETLIKVIRNIDPKSLIIVGTPTWSQRVDMAAKDPIDADDIAYTIHFYAGTHGNDIREHVRFALKQGIALFSTEWGMSKASGTGGIYTQQSQLWLDFFDEHHISWVNWSVINKNESSAALKPIANGDGKWSYHDLSKSGLWVKNRLRAYNNQ